MLIRLGGQLRLKSPHPMAGRMAFQCDVCNGISYPDHQSEDGSCPYYCELPLTFENLSQVLDEARSMRREDAYVFLRERLLTMEMDNEMRRWFVRELGDLVDLDVSGLG